MSELWEVASPTVLELLGALTPELLGAILLTIFATHAAKVLAPDSVRKARGKWTRYSMTVSLTSGLLFGSGVWVLLGGSWMSPIIVPLVSGPLWRVLIFLLPFARNSLTTETDQKFMRGNDK